MHCMDCGMFAPLIVHTVDEYCCGTAAATAAAHKMKYPRRINMFWRGIEEDTVHILQSLDVDDGGGDGV